jgi:hypothetical protein
MSLAKFDSEDLAKRLSFAKVAVLAESLKILQNRLATVGPSSDMVSMKHHGEVIGWTLATA